MLFLIVLDVLYVKWSRLNLGGLKNLS